jgi:hypothetical protein
MQQTPTQALAFRLGESPPRRITWVMRVAVWLTLTFTGAFPVGFGGAFALATLFRVDPLAYLGPGDRAVTVTGDVVSFSHHKSKGRHTGDTAIVSFIVDGRAYEIARYTSGDSLHLMSGEVTVDVDPRHPSRARVHGMRVADAGMPFLVGVMGLLALGMTTWGTVRARKRLWLLENGLFTQATLLDHEQRKGSKGKVTHVLTFEYQVGVEAFTHVVKTQSDPQRLLDEEGERILYDPQKPERAFVLDELELQPRHDETGAVGYTKKAPVVRAALFWAVAMALAVASVAYPLTANAP